MKRLSPLWIGVLAVACLALGWAVHRPAPGPVRYRTVTVTKRLLVQGEPVVQVRWRDRIVTRTVKAEQVAEAPKAGVADVRDFCAPTVRTALADTTAPLPDRRLLLRSLSFDGNDLEAWGPTSDGALWRGSYRTHAPWTLRVDGDSAVVRSRRLWWVNGAIRGALLVGAGAVAGAVLH